MEGRTKLKRNFSFAGITLLICLSVFFVGWKSTQNHTQTITFKQQEFEVFTVKNPNKIVFGYADSLGNQLNNFKNFKAFQSKKGNDLFLLLTAVCLRKHLSRKAYTFKTKLKFNQSIWIAVMVISTCFQTVFLV